MVTHVIQLRIPACGSCISTASGIPPWTRWPSAPSEVSTFPPPLRLMMIRCARPRRASQKPPGACHPPRSSRSDDSDLHSLASARTSGIPFRPRQGSRVALCIPRLTIDITAVSHPDTMLQTVIPALQAPRAPSSHLTATGSPRPLLRSASRNVNNPRPSSCAKISCAPRVVVFY